MAGDEMIEQGVTPAAPASRPALTVVGGTGPEVHDMDNVVTKYMRFTINEQEYIIKREIPFKVGLELMQRFKRNRATADESKAAGERAHQMAIASGKSEAEAKMEANLARAGVMDSSDSLVEMFDLFAVVFSKAKPKPLTAEDLKDMLSMQSASKLLAVLAENVFKDNEDAGDPLPSNAGGSAG